MMQAPFFTAARSPRHACPDGRAAVATGASMMMTVNIARDFTRYPSGRYRENSASSAEEFRERFLQPPLLRGEKIRVEFDGTTGYSSSFLEEAFGGVVRSTHKPAAYILPLLQFESSDLSLVEEVRQYIAEASDRLK